uniref:Uncharacterized protein n=1 Tax=Trypanosoma congolense (strain IL3000) TaxID=1068625 RepID=G0UU47_TRYCI|nr:conserved hypothetical protein [Trypanosoma congolense IL3000]
MSLLSLAPSAALCMGSKKKPSCARVVACYRTHSQGLYVMFLNERKADLRFWHAKRGITSFCGADRYNGRIVDVACDDYHTLVFFHHDKGRRLGIALMEHKVLKPTHTTSAPIDCSSDFEAVVAPLIQEEQGGKKMTALLLVSRSCIKQTASGPIVGVLLSTPTGDIHVVIGSPKEGAWRRFALEQSFGMPMCLCIKSERVISVAKCFVGPPVDESVASLAPTVELALSLFDRSCMSSTEEGSNRSRSKTNDGKNLRGKGTALHCVTMQEMIFSIDDRDAVIHSFYQSQLFPIPETESGSYAPPYCQLYSDRQNQRYAAFVVIGAHSYVIHLQRSQLNMDMVVSCTRIGISGIPRSAMWLTLPHPSGRDDQSLDIVVLLSQDYRLYATDVRGGAFCVQFGENQPDNAVAFTLPSKLHCDAAAYLEGFSCMTHLIQVAGGEFVCTNGILGMVLCVTDLRVDPSALCDVPSRFAEDADGPERRIVLLTHCLQCVEGVLDSPAPVAMQMIFQRIFPTLHCAGSTQNEMYFVQRVFQGILTAASPKTVEEWRLMWSCALLLRKTLSKRSRDNTVVYTDHFFVSLLEHYAHLQGTEDEREQAMEGLLNVVSDELKSTWSSFFRKLDDDVLLVMDRLAENTVLPLAEEIGRRMVTVNILSDGTHVVSAKGNVSHVVHALGVVLLASCLGVDVYVEMSESNQLSCRVAPVASTAVLIPSQYARGSAEFDYALTLSADLLCVTAPDTEQTPPCATALLAMLSGQRYRVVFTFLQIFALPLAQQLKALQPFSNNTKLLEDCSAAASLTEQALLRDMLLRPTASHILQVLCNGSLQDDQFNIGLWRQIGGVLNAEMRAFIIASLLHAMTDRVIAAQNNYSTSIAKALLRDSRVDPLHDASVRTCRARLHILLSKLEKLWADVETWSPYKSADVANCLLSVSATYRSAGVDNVHISSNGSSVSRTYVVCFRLLCLVGYSYRTEDEVIELMHAVNNVESLVNAIKGLLCAMENLKGTALPVELFRCRCLGLVALSVEACKRNPGLALLLLNALEASGTSTTRVEALRHYYEDVVSLLVEMKDDDTDGGNFSEMLRLPDREKENGACSSDVKRRLYFIWSKSGGSSVPNWPGVHNLETRRDLIDIDWVDTIWPVERTPENYSECITSVRECILRSGTTDSNPLEELSPQLSVALFQQLCVITPPVRLHSPSTTKAPETVSGIACSSVTPASAATEHPSIPSQPRSSGPAVHQTPQMPLSPQREERSVGNSSTTSSSSGSLKAAKEAPVLRQTAVAPIQAAEAPRFSPDFVAWWETDDVETTVTESRRPTVKKRQPADMVDTESNTSYTTLTTEPSAYVGVDIVTTSTSHASRHKCRRHCNRHCGHRCTKHRPHCHCDVGQKPYPEQRPNRPQTSRAHVIHTDAHEGRKGIELLKFESKLQPPPLPTGLAGDVLPRTPGTGRGLSGKDVINPPQLLSLNCRPYAPRVALFVWDKGCAERRNLLSGVDGSNNRAMSTLPSSTTRNVLPPQEPLRPPPLPASDVFAKPPTLLTLRTRAFSPLSAGSTSKVDWTKFAEYASMLCTIQNEAQRIADNESLPSREDGLTSEEPKLPREEVTGQPSLAVADAEGTSKHGVVSFSNNAVPVPASIRTHEAAVPPTTPLTSTMRKVELTPEEEVAFHYYVDNIKTMGVGTVSSPAVSIPLPAPLPSSDLVTAPPAASAPVASPPPSQFPLCGLPVTATVGAAVETAGGSSPTELQRNNELLDVVREMIHRSEQTQTRNFNMLMETIRAKHEAQAPQSRMAEPSTEPVRGGLSAIEQAQLLRHTIEQKDRLLVMNQELMDIHSRAQRLAGSASPAPSVQPQPLTIPQAPHSTDTESHSVPLAAPVDVVSPQLLQPVPTPKDDDAAGRNAVQNSGKTDATTCTGDAIEPHQAANRGLLNTGSAAPCIPSTQSIDLTFSTLQQINEDLRRASATADDMERAIRQSRSLLQEHTSMQVAHASAVEGSLLMDAARARTTALEQQLISMNESQSQRSFIKQQTASPGVLEEQPTKPTGSPCTTAGYTTDEVNGATTSELASPTQFRFTNETITEPEWFVSDDQDQAPPQAQPLTQQQQDFGDALPPKTDGKPAYGVPPSLSTTAPASVVTIVPTHEMHSERVPSWHEHERSFLDPDDTVAFSPLLVEKDLLPHSSRRGSLTPRVKADLMQLYNREPPTRMKRLSNTRETSRGSRARTPSGTGAIQDPPKRFAMYAPAARTRTPSSRIGSSKRMATPSKQSAWVEKKHLTATATPKKLKQEVVKPAESRRDRNRRDMLVLHTSKRLAELQRAFS